MKSKKSIFSGGLGAALALGLVVFFLGGGVSYGAQAWLEEHKGVRLLHLSGSRAEMAAQHGKIWAKLKKEGHETALPFFLNRVSNSIAQSKWVRRFPFLKGPMEYFFHLFVTRKSVGELLPDDRKMLEAFAESAGLDPDDMLRGWVVPDTGQWINARFYGENRFLSGAFGPVSELGCSSFVISPSRSSVGMIHARNLDYESYTVYDQFPTVIYYHPDQGQKYLSVSSLGIHTAGITGMNESGLIVEIHVTTLDETSLSGRPILSVTEQVIREAKTFQQAIQLLKSANYASSWKVMISSHREGKAAEVDVSAKGVRVHPMSGTELWGTNHVYAEDTSSRKDTEFSTSYRYYSDSHLRYQTLKGQFARLGEKGKADEQFAVNTISSHEFVAQGQSKDFQQRAFHGVLSRMNNIQSVVFVPQKGLAYVAVPRIPGAKPLQGNYVPVPIDFTRMSKEDFLKSLSELPQSLRGENSGSESLERAMARYRQGAHLLTSQRDFEKGVAAVEEATRYLRSEPVYTVMLAATYLKWAGSIAGDGDPSRFIEKAVHWLERAFARRLPPYLGSLAHLLSARIHDIRGSRGLAIQAYQKVEEGFSRALREAKQAGLKVPYRLESADEMVLDYVVGDLKRF